MQTLYKTSRYTCRTHSEIMEYVNIIIKRIPFNSHTQKPWSQEAIIRVVLETPDRDYNPDDGRDMQDMFVSLIKQRTNDASVRQRIADLAEQEYIQEQTDIAAGYIGETVPCLLRRQAD